MVYSSCILKLYYEIHALPLRFHGWGIDGPLEEGFRP
jgi:hypothetical protein